MIQIKLDSSTVIEKYSDMVYRIAVTHTKSKEDAEDVFQEVFLSLIRHRNQIEDENHLKYWLIRTTLNQCKNNQACFWKRRVIFDTEAPAEQSAEEYEIFSLKEELKKLSPKLRDVVYLYYYEGYSVEEIANILKLRIGTVKSRLFCARKILKEQLSEVQNEN